MSFHKYCENLGIELLKDDIKFIKFQLLHFPQQLHKSILTKYADIFLQGIASTDIVYKQQNAGRRLANTFLREFKQ